MFLRLRNKMCIAKLTADLELPDYTFDGTSHDIYCRRSTGAGTAGMAGVL
jgi:hypothetical protein